MTGLKRTLRSRRGFTLVELVVVLVIAGITASFAVPALTGYIDNAKEKQAVSETQACVMAATRIAAQKYAEWQKNTTYQLAGGKELTSSAEFQPLVGCTGTTSNTPPAVTGGDVALTEGSGQYLLHVSKYEPGGFPKTGSTADISAAASVTGTIQTLTCSSSGQVVYLVYTSKDGITVVYTNNGRSSTVSTKADAIVVPTPGPDSSGGTTGGGETGGGGTTGGGETGGGGMTGGGETGSTATAGEKQFIIHMQDVSTGNSFPFANKRYHIKSGKNDFYVKSDSNGDILLDISPNESWLQRSDTVIGDTPTFITEDEVPAGYQIIPSDTKININVIINGNDYYLNSIQDGGNYNSGVVDKDNRRLTIMRFPIAKLKLRVTNREGEPLPRAIFDITSGSDTVTLTCDDKGECSIPVKLHDGDNIGESPYLTAESQPNHTYVIKETYPPAGYQGDITCSFHLYYKPYPSEPSPHWQTWFYIDSNNGDHGEWGKYEKEKTVGENDSFHVINTKRQLCTVYIRKIDDRGVTVSGAQLVLTSTKEDSIFVNQWYGYKQEYFYTPASKSYELKPDTYTLQETVTPSGYTTATPITFTISKGEYNKVITMVDHNVNEKTGDVTLDTITFINAQNWAYKLTQDSSIKFRQEILYWKGNYYYSYKGRDGLTNPYKQYWSTDASKNRLDLDADSNHGEYIAAPDPVVFFSEHKKNTYDDFVLQLGKVWNETTIKTVSSSNTIKRGDLYLYQNKLYVYTGYQELTSAPPAQPNNSTSANRYDYAKFWEKIDDGKYTIN